MSSDQLTPTQQAILYKKDDHPEWTNREIADAVGCSESHVSETLNEYSLDDVDGVQESRSGVLGWVFSLTFTIIWWCLVTPIKISWFVFVQLPLRLIFGPKDS